MVNDNMHMFIEILLIFSDPSVLAAVLTGHTGAIWGLSVHSSSQRLLSCSTDGTVRLWDPYSKEPLLKTFSTPSGER